METRKEPNGSEPFSELSAFQRDVMTVIAREGPEYGLGIKRKLQELYSEDINHGRLYPNLDELVRDGLLAKEPYDKRTNHYSLTDAGEEILVEYEQWLSSCLEANTA